MIWVAACNSLVLRSRRRRSEAVTVAQTTAHEERRTGVQRSQQRTHVVLESLALVDEDQRIRSLQRATCIAVIEFQSTADGHRCSCRRSRQADRRRPTVCEGVPIATFADTLALWLGSVSPERAFGCSERLTRKPLNHRCQAPTRFAIDTDRAGSHSCDRRRPAVAFV